MKLAENLGHIEPAERYHRPDVDGSRQRATVVTDRIPGQPRRLDHPARVFPKELTGRRDLDLLPGPVEQFDAEFLLQLAHRCGERGLDDMNPLRGAGEVHLARYRDEVLELTELHPIQNINFSEQSA